MAMRGLRTIGRVTGAAATTAPYMRRLATDQDLRDDVTDFVRSSNNLMHHLRSDRRLRRDVNKMVSSVQSGVMPGAKYQGWRSELGRMARGNDAEAHFAGQVKKALNSSAKSAWRIAA